jgi:hypothetical protein
MALLLWNLRHVLMITKHVSSFIIILRIFRPGCRLLLLFFCCPIGSITSLELARSLILNSDVTQTDKLICVCVWGGDFDPC